MWLASSLYYACVGPPSESFEGYCRDASNNNQAIDYIYTNSANKCHNLCKNTAGCDAFAFDRTTKNCIVYQGGPYTQGTGENDITCFSGILCYDHNSV